MANGGGVAFEFKNSVLNLENIQKTQHLICPFYINVTPNWRNYRFCTT